jgi:cytochrome c-type biogenesis protein CcmH/NrfF
MRRLARLTLILALTGAALVAPVSGAALAPAGIALAADPRASLPDIEDEVMCLECKTPLNQSNAAVADRERAFIRREIAQGKTKQEIKDALVDRFGPAVLAVPDDQGFDLAAYVVPPLVALLGLIAVGVAAIRWRRSPRPDEATHELDPADARRLDRELAAYDRERAPPP